MAENREKIDCRFYSSEDSKEIMSHSDSEINGVRELHQKFRPRVCARLQMIGCEGSLKPQLVVCRRTRSNQIAASLERYKHKLKKMRLQSASHMLSAAARNDTEAVELQLKMGVNPNSADMHGRTALHIAASKGYADLVRLLLETGADPNRSDNLFNTPLHIAACTHFTNVMSLLLNGGADASLLDVYGKNPLQLVESKLQLLQNSWRSGSVEMAKLQSELKSLVDILILELSRKRAVNMDELEMMKLSLNSPDPLESVDDQMSKLLKGLQEFRLS